MQYRNELKHLITPGDRAAICAVMRTVAQLDPHAQSKGFYTIRSLYFDSLSGKALREKLDGSANGRNSASAITTGTRMSSIWKRKSKRRTWAISSPAR